jgi:non-specific serine/threonine protein kinase/serine/threonine-protein kinase
MSAEQRLDRVRQLFEDALELPPGERDVFLEQACAGDRELLGEVNSLLLARDDAEKFLERPAALPDENRDLWVGRTVGHYRIVDVLAAGGMGMVYRAEQDQPRRQVALKLIRSGAVSPELLKRFKLEAEVLGRLDHPGIARILEASTTDPALGGQPFFAMELVEGPPLTRFAEQGKLRTRERLELLIKVCEAVNHAHRQGVIHRDLKPANILVREDGQPKVLDFGVARITDADLQVTTMHTDLGRLIGTLAYMSPEQVRGRHAELDTRSDVYALGVLGYELLTGKLPQPLAGKSVSEAARIIEHEDPQTLASTGSSFPADLETIIRKCLEKEKERRYGSPAELAADLRRFLDHEPISARPPSALYQFSRFARRNRALVTGAGLALAALVIGLAISLAGWNSANTARRQADKARQRAETEAEKASMLNTYLSQMLEAPDPWADGMEVKVVDVLAKASATLEETLGGQPEVAAMAHYRLGYTYSSLGLYEQAEPHIRRAEEISREVSGFPPRARVEILADLGHLLLNRGELEEAEQQCRAAVDLAGSSLGEDTPERIKSEHELALVLWEKGELDEAEKLFRRCYEQSAAVRGPEDEETMATMEALGNVLRQQGRREEARPLLERAYAFCLETSGEDHPRTAIALNNLAFIYQELEEHDRALEMFRRSLESRRRVQGNDSTSVIVGLNNVGLQLGLMGRGEEALPCIEEAMAAAGRALGPEHWFGPAIRSTYGRTLLGLGRYADAEREMLASLAGLRRTLGDDHWRTKKLCGNLAELYDATGDSRQAEEYRARAVEEASGTPES